MKSSWLDLGILYPGKPTGSLHEPGSWPKLGGGQPGAAQEAPGAAQEHRGVARRSSWLFLGILRNMAQGSQEQPRKHQEQPKSSQESQEKLLAGFGPPGQHG